MDDKTNSHLPVVFNNKLIKEKLEIKKNIIKNNIYKNNLFSKFSFFIILFIKILLSNEQKLNFGKLSFLSEITMTIKGKGDQYILNNGNCHIDKTDYLFDEKPDQIIINGVPQSYSGNMVHNLTNEENIITIKFKNLLKECNGMFCNLNNITKIDLSKFDSSKVTEMIGMFYNCDSLTSINLDKFKTVSSNSIKRMFDGCNKLTSLNLSSFDTSSVTDMTGLFSNCKSLLSLDLNNFNTSSVTIMDVMFINCSSLKYLDLNNFDTSSVTSFHGIFKFCNSLMGLKIDNFNTSTAGNINQMFYYCTSLISLNLVNFDHSAVTRKINNMFDGISKDIIFCFNETKVPRIKEKIEEILNENYINNCSHNCFSSTNSKILEDQKICVSDCFNNGQFRYEYLNICYQTCPNNTHISSDNLTCENDNETMRLLKNFDVDKFFNGSYHINDSDPFVKDQIINIIKEDIKSGKINLTDLVEGEQNDYILKEADAIYQITSTENQKNKEYDISTIQLGQCEGILKKIYNISKELPLIIFKVEYFVPGIQIPVIGYNVFHPNNKTKLDLNYCKDSLINFDIPVSIDEDELFKYDPNSEYYTNECFSYTTDNKTDMLLNDRQYEYNNNNLSLCENNCSFSEYDKDSKKVECNCNASTKDFIISEILKDENILSSHNFINKNPSLNIYTMKCVYTLFTEEGLKSNIGNYIMILITIIFIILIILFYKVGYELLLEDIQRLIKNADKLEDITRNNKMRKKSIGLKKRKKSEKNVTIYSKNRIRMNIKKYTQDVNNSNIKSSKSTKILKLFNSSNDDNRNSLDIKGNVQTNKYNNNFNDYELNSLSFEKALEYDKRTFLQYYFSLLRTKHPIIYLFNTINDYNSRIVKFSIFLLLFSIIYILNALFYNKDSIHKIYENQGQYDFKFFLPQILYSFLISQILYISIKYLSLSEKDIMKVKNDPKNEEKAKQVQQCLFIKYILFYILGLIFLIFFWYYLSSFCAVFVNSQIYLIDNTIISLSISLLYPFFINFLPCTFRINSLNKKNKCFYNISKILQII